MMALPHPRAFLTSLITSLNTSSTLAAATTSNPLKQATPAERSTLLTLHVLYPNELLAALDLLDRELVVRMTPHSPPNPPPPTTTTITAIAQSDIQTEGATTEQDLPTTSLDQTREARKDTSYDNAVYYVRSAQQTSSNSRFRDAVASSMHYEVRTSSWSCSCPAFVFAAFPVASFNEEEADGQIVAEEGESREWRFGGLSLGKDVPMCKHLLACVLAERVDSFRGYVKTREVSIEEVAGWAAGWGG